MEHGDKIHSADQFSARVLANGGVGEHGKIIGEYDFKCYRKGLFGRKKLVWQDKAPNIITDLGANFALNQAFGAAQNTTYYLGLISSVGYTTPPAVANSMSLHTGWTEAGDSTNMPQWGIPALSGRAAITWNAASARAKSLNAAASFTIATNGGTLKGGFIVTGSGASATHDDTNGTLFSAGLFSLGDKVVQVGDVVQVSYTVTLS